MPAPGPGLARAPEDRPIGQPRPAVDFALPFEALAGARGGIPPSLGAFLDAAESWLIARALEDAGGNRSAAARRLGIGRRTLYSKLARLGVGGRGARAKPRSRGA